MHKTVIDMKRKIDSNTIIVGDFNTPHSMDRSNSNGQIINTENE